MLPAAGALRYGIIQAPSSTELLEALDAQGGRMAFCQATPTIGKTLRIMGLLLRATLHDTEAKAVQALEADRSEEDTPTEPP